MKALQLTARCQAVQSSYSLSVNGDRPQEA